MFLFSVVSFSAVFMFTGPQKPRFWCTQSIDTMAKSRQVRFLAQQREQYVEHPPDLSGPIFPPRALLGSKGEAMANRPLALPFGPLPQNCSQQEFGGWLRNPIRTTWNPGEASLCWYFQENHSRISWVVRCMDFAIHCINARDRFRLPLGGPPCWI